MYISGNQLIDVADSTVVVLLYFLTMVSTKFHIIVDRVIGTFGHGKCVVDGINVCDKRYLMGEMCMIDTPEADDKQSRMNAHSMVGSASFNLAK